MPTDFPTRIRDERARLGWTQEDAAAALDMSRDQYKKLENKAMDINTSTLARLVKAGYRLEVIAPELVER